MSGTMRLPNSVNFNLFPSSEEQRAAKFGFQLLNGRRQRGLRNMAGLGRPREVQSLRGGLEVAHLIHFHVGMPPLVPAETPSGTELPGGR